ncbi:MAG: intradiol ring-cleavage dioxygenase [Alphaproteobacteria bacterium]|nr:intradiol ring-cleavage dioxygenase [Alphaproteobacteria bacterium]
MHKPMLSRRGLLAQLGCALPIVGLTANAWAQGGPTVTPRQTEGPFYPRQKPADIDNDLTAFGTSSRPAVGDQLTVQGRVLDRSGNPIPGARVEFWHCDTHGTYHHVGSDGQIDQYFQGYGEMLTDVEGHYDFRTIKPGIYPGRACHIHFKVFAPGHRPLTSQMYFDTEMEANLRDGIYRRLSEAERKAVTLSTSSRSGRQSSIEGQLDVVVA